MSIVVGFVSQKGGVGKSTLARALASVAAHSGLKVRIADLDPQQKTVVRWEQARAANRVVPNLMAKAYGTVADVLADQEGDELLIIDGPARASAGTLKIAESSHLVVQPTGASRDDLEPAVRLYHELVRASVPRARLVLALCRTLADAEELAAREYLKEAGYAVLPGALRERMAYREAQNKGHAVTETPHKSLNDQADALMAALLRSVREQVEALHRTRRKGGRVA